MGKVMFVELLYHFWVIFSMRDMWLFPSTYPFFERRIEPMTLYFQQTFIYFLYSKRCFLLLNLRLYASGFACVGQVVGQMRKRRQNELAAALPFSPFDPFHSEIYGVNSKCEIWTFNAEKPPKTAVFPRNLVRVTGFEPAASCSQSRRATNCATPGYLIF